MSIESLADHFKPEDRKRGEDLFNGDVVYVASATDTTVRASLKASGAPRVSLEAADVTSPSIAARCSCPPARKGVLCKHIWATLLKLESRDADFLNDKTDVSVQPEDAKPDPAAARRREHAERQRLRAKEMRREKKAVTSPKSSSRALVYPDPVAEALAYFKDNGFDLAEDLELEHVMNAKRVLARVFHPDKGGTHEEAVALNENFTILSEYLSS